MVNKKKKMLLGGLLIIVGIFLMNYATYKVAYQKGLDKGGESDYGKRCETLVITTDEPQQQEEKEKEENATLQAANNWKVEHDEEAARINANNYVSEGKENSDHSDTKLKVEEAYVEPNEASSSKNEEEAKKKEEEGWKRQDSSASDEQSKADNIQPEEYQPEEYQPEEYQPELEEPATPQVNDSLEGEDLEVLPQEKIAEEVEATEIIALDGYETTVGSAVQFKITGTQNPVIDGLDSAEYSFAGGILTVNVMEAGCLTFTIDGIQVNLVVNGF